MASVVRMLRWSSTMRIFAMRVDLVILRAPLDPGRDLTQVVAGEGVGGGRGRAGGRRERISARHVVQGGRRAGLMKGAPELGVLVVRHAARAAHRAEAEDRGQATGSILGHARPAGVLVGADESGRRRPQLLRASVA